MDTVQWSERHCGGQLIFLGQDDRVLSVGQIACEGGHPWETLLLQGLLYTKQSSIDDSGNSWG